MADEMVCVRFSREDLKLLIECEKLEKLKRSDVVRRAVRHYAEYLQDEASSKKPTKRASRWT